MFNIANEITLEKLKSWIEICSIETNKLNKLGHYTLHVSKPELFDEDSRSKLDSMPIFTGMNLEEIFVKMYDYCLNNLKWNDGKNVNLIEHPEPLNDLLLANNIIKEIDGNYYTRDFTKTSQDDFTLEKYGYDIKLTKDNMETIEDAAISLIYDCKLYTLGFITYNKPDTCFHVESHELC